MNKKRKTKYVSFYRLHDGKLVEEILYNSRPALLSYDPSTETWEIADRIDAGGLELRPIDEDPIHKGALPLPSGIEEYGTTAALTREIRKYIHRYLDLAEKEEVLCVFYILMTWVHDKFRETPFLRFKGEPGTGKSRATLEIIGPICYKPAIGSPWWR